MTAPAIGSHLSRSFKLRDRSALNVEARTVEIAVASEAIIERDFGREQLVVRPGAVDLARLQAGAPLLCDHDRRDQVGVIEEARVDSDHVVRVRVRFGSSARAREVFQDVVDGIRRHASIGYIINEIETTSDRDGEVVRVVNWSPFEASLVSVPADTRVGVGRQQGTDANTVTIVERNRPMSNTTATDERARVVEIQALADSRHGRAVEGIDTLARRAVADGTSVDQFRAEIMDKASPSQVLKPEALIGMSARDVERFSMLRFIEAQASRDWSKAGFERECSLAAAKLQRNDPQGAVLPYDVLVGAQARDLSATLSGHTGENLIGTDHRADLFIDQLRDAPVVAQVGATVATGLVGDQAIPRQDSGAEFEFIDNETYSGSGSTEPVLSNVIMTPHTMKAKTVVTRRVTLQSSPLAEALILRDFRRGHANAIDRTVFTGAGTAIEPQGLIGMDGVGLVECGDNGGALDWPKVVDLWTEVAANNADRGNLAFVTNARVRGALMKLAKHETAVGGDFVWSDRGTLAGHKALVSNVVPSDLTKGSGTDLSAIVFGAWDDLLVGVWGGLDVLVDPYSDGDRGAIVIRMFIDIDIAVKRPESFAMATDVITS